MRVHFQQKHMTLEQADLLEAYLRSIEGIDRVQVFDRTADAIILYTAPRAEVLSALIAFSYEDIPEEVKSTTASSRALTREYQDKLVNSVVWHYGKKLLLPAPLRYGLSIWRAIGYVKEGLASLSRGKLDVSVLDATSISVSLLRGDFNTAGSVMFLLHVGELLEEWTHKKSVEDLARSMSLNVDKVWLRRNGVEELVPLSAVRVGDEVVLRTSNTVPLDGKIIEGEASINQASITGESLPVRKAVGSYAYAGTVVEEGECILLVEQVSGNGQYDRIIRMIEESEALKSGSENRAYALADRLVPYSLGGTLLAWLVTGSATRALSVLMVDFSCALKLAMPISVLSAMRECSQYHISVKGGKYLEAIAHADTIVFDKTGTLTHACPRVAQIIPFGGLEEDEILKTAACLEEHYPHSMANAVVTEAKRRGLSHEERHSRVEYVVAHGISSRLDGEKVIIGSYHFVFEDEGCTIPDGEEERFATLPDEYSHLYLAISGVLAAVICIADPLREEADAVLNSLRRLGIGKMVMMTGDNDRTARLVARQVGVDEYYAEVLPQDKAAFIRQEHAAGRTVVMIGDGVNDTPALSESDVGIAISDGAAIAREIADITIAADDLVHLVTLKCISDSLMRRIDSNYRFIIGFNLMLILLGVGGVLQPATSALLHNASTLGIGMYSMTELL